MIKIPVTLLPLYHVPVKHPFRARAGQLNELILRVRTSADYRFFDRAAKRSLEK